MRKQLDQDASLIFAPISFRQYAELIAEAQVRDAVRGNVQAAREIADRTEGKPRQSIEFEDKTFANAFVRMTPDELERYAATGQLPDGFPRNKASDPEDR